MSVAAWNLAYASNNVVHAQCEQQYNEAKKTIEDGCLLFENLQNSGQEMKQVMEQLELDLEASKKTILELTEERDAICQALTEENESKEEMYDDIILDHSRGFKKALRQTSHLLNLSLEGVNFDIYKDVYKGKMVPIETIPVGTFPDDDPAAESAAVETMMEEVDTNAITEVPALENAQNILCTVMTLKTCFCGGLDFFISFNCYRFDFELLRIIHCLCIRLSQNFAKCLMVYACTLLFLTRKVQVKT